VFPSGAQRAGPFADRPDRFQRGPEARVITVGLPRMWPHSHQDRYQGISVNAVGVAHSAGVTDEVPQKRFERVPVWMILRGECIDFAGSRRA